MNSFNLTMLSFIVIMMASSLTAASTDELEAPIKNLYDYLLQREYAGPVPLSDHQVERKAVRSPSLRLRFGRRNDPSVPLRQLIYPNQIIDSEVEQKSIRSPSLRLRFGKRNDALMNALNENFLFDEEPIRRKPQQRTPSRRLRFGRTDPSLMATNEVNPFPADDMIASHLDDN